MAAVDNIKDIPYKVEVGQRLFQIVAMDGSSIQFDISDSYFYGYAPQLMQRWQTFDGDGERLPLSTGRGTPSRRGAAT